MAAVRKFGNNDKFQTPLYRGAPAPRFSRPPLKLEKTALETFTLGESTVLVSEGYGGSSASPGSGSNAPALDAQAQQLDQAVEEAGRSSRRCRT